MIELFFIVSIKRIKLLFCYRNLNGNSLSGRIPAALGGRLLHRAKFKYVFYNIILFGLGLVLGEASFNILSFKVALVFRFCGAK